MARDSLDPNQTLDMLFMPAEAMPILRNRIPILRYSIAQSCAARYLASRSNPLHRHADPTPCDPFDPLTPHHETSRAITKSAVLDLIVDYDTVRSRVCLPAAVRVGHVQEKDGNIVCVDKIIHHQ